MKRTRIQRKTRLKTKSKRHSQTKVLDDLCRQIVLARDHNRCRKCGQEGKGGRGGALHSAHILPKGQYPALRWEIDNLLSLCYRCHLHWWHKAPLEAAKWIEAELGTKQLERLRLIGLARRRTDRKALQIYLSQFTA